MSMCAFITILLVFFRYNTWATSNSGEIAWIPATVMLFILVTYAFMDFHGT